MIQYVNDNRVFLILLSVFIFLFGCKTKNENIEEGVIHYNIEYLNVNEDDLISEILPQKMKMYFTNKNNVSGFMILSAGKFI